MHMYRDASFYGTCSANIVLTILAVPPQREPRRVKLDKLEWCHGGGVHSHGVTTVIMTIFTEGV